MNKRKIEKIAYDVIEKAIKGDVIAINTIVNQYEPLINKLATVQAKDDYGNPYWMVNAELKQNLQTKLITSILKFKPMFD